MSKNAGFRLQIREFDWANKRRDEKEFLEGDAETLPLALSFSLQGPQKNIRAIWDDSDDKQPEMTSVVNQPSQKQRLASFQTTDALLTPLQLKFPSLTATDDKRAEFSADENSEIDKIEKQPSRKDSKRMITKGHEKLKGKIRKLKGFWESKLRVPPHIFKRLSAHEEDILEEQDLSKKGAVGGKSEAEENRAEELSEMLLEEP